MIRIVRIVLTAAFLIFIIPVLPGTRDQSVEHKTGAVTTDKGSAKITNTAKNKNSEKKDAPRSGQAAAKKTGNEKKETDANTKFWVTVIVTLVVGFIGREGIRAIIKYFKKKKIRFSKAMTARGRYCSLLREKLGHIEMLGSPDIESKTVKLEDAFVSLGISRDWRCDDRFEPQKKISKHEMGRHLSPEQVMRLAFKRFRLMLVIGDPGSGKTTLLKYYAINCLNKKHRRFGFKKWVLPLYFPLRELTFLNGTDKDTEKIEPASLPHNLAAWARRHSLPIPEKQFRDWLQNRKTLVLLDGLDEISSKEQRRNVCRWVANTCAGLENACFVLTSRVTGYRKLDGIELEIPHLRADIMDFSPRQQEAFLKKWFQAVYLFELLPEEVSIKEWNRKQMDRAAQQSEVIIDFLKREENKAVQELAVVPMLLQIMAIMWKDRQHLPKTRSTLYDAALNYLLEHRDRQRDIEPMLPAKESRRVLAPTALWMQEDLKQDEVQKQEMHRYMEPILNTLEGQPEASSFCSYLRDRTGMIADYDREHYIFRHKSFREYLAGMQLKEEAYRENRLNMLVSCYNEDWWEEPLRFFMSEANDKIFDQFMELFFKSPVSRQLDDHRQTLLKDLIKDAPQKKIDALKEVLDRDDVNENQKRYAMDCLKTIGTNEAIQAIAELDKTRLSKSNLSYAEDIIAEAASKPVTPAEKSAQKKRIPGLPPSFRGNLEGNVEYIKIPGGTYKYSVTKERVTVPDLYFCKYPVTNKRYRQFISYLEGNESFLLEEIPLSLFAKKLLKFSRSIKGYKKYLGRKYKKWPVKLRSRYDDNKKFNGDDHPVVGVTWYAVRAYCFWLSCLDAVINRGEKLQDIKDMKWLASLFRLPTEMEWEWAAGGEPDGSIREYPWPKERGEPTPKLANYGENVGATTPVGRYPEGATPQGLMDMAGNVWEWMENLYSKERKYPALRGGSWDYPDSNLRCSSRYFGDPDYVWNYVIGFRVVSPAQS